MMGNESNREETNEVFGFVAANNANLFTYTSTLSGNAAD